MSFESEIYTPTGSHEQGRDSGIENLIPQESPIDFYRALEREILIEDRNSFGETTANKLSQLSPNEQIQYIEALLKIGVFYSRREEQHFKILGVMDREDLPDFRIMQELYGKSDIPIRVYNIGSRSLENPEFTPTLKGTRLVGINDAIFVRGNNHSFLANELSHVEFLHMHFNGDDTKYREIAEIPTKFFNDKGLPARDLIEVNEFQSDACSLNSYIIPEDENKIDLKKLAEVKGEVARILQIGIIHNLGNTMHLMNYACTGKIMIEIVQGILEDRGMNTEDSSKLLGKTESTEAEKIGIIKKYNFSGDFSINELRKIQKIYRDKALASNQLVTQYLSS